ncbi:transient receptor potential cation channel subfamily M member-like 2 [Glandiceps talaboti]
MSKVQPSDKTSTELNELGNRNNEKMEKSGDDGEDQDHEGSESLKATSRHPRKDIEQFVKDKEFKQRKDVDTTEDANSFGEIEFVGFGQFSNKISPYIRVDKKTKARDLWKLLHKYWRKDKPKPKVLISVTGGAKDFFFNDDRLKNLFNKGLFKAAVSTDAWIITGGTGEGVMKKVGEAIREESRGTIENEVVALGIATWNVIDNKEVLVNSKNSGNGLWPAKYIETALHNKGTSLDSNHTHFILVDHGKPDYGADIELRARLEKYIAKHAAGKETCFGKCLSGKHIPVVLVVVEGGPGTIKTVHESLKRKVPAVIVKGSGRAADFIANALLKSKDTKSSTDSVESMINKELTETIPGLTKGSPEFKDCIDLLVKIVESKEFTKLITLFDIEESKYNDIDGAILHSILQAPAISESVYGQLELALNLNRCDIARNEIITAEKRREWQSVNVDDIMTKALKENKADFIELFLAHLVNLEEFLTSERLEELYEVINMPNCIDGKTSCTDILQEQLQSGEGEVKEILFKVGKLLKDLTRDECGVLYQEKGAKSEEIDNADKHLFLWAVLLNRMALAKLFWRRLRTCNIGAALIAARILKHLSKYAQKNEELSLCGYLTNHASEFEDLAIGVLDHCYEDDKKKAKLSLVRTLRDWGNSTCIQIAYSSELMKFIEHDCCQTKLQRAWKGNLQIHSTLQWIGFAVGTLFPIFPFMTFLWKDYVEIEAEGREHAQKADITDNKIHNYLFRGKSEIKSCGKAEEVRHSGGSIDDVTFWEGLTYYYTAPVTKFMYNVIAYIILLFLFGLFILTDLHDGKPSTIEYVVIIWVGTLIVDEFRQVFTRQPNTFRYKVYSWASEIWNRFDLVMYLLFILSLILRLSLPASAFSAARVSYSVTFICFCVRLLPMGFVSQDIGPKVIMILKMLNDLLYFLFILVVFIVGFGVANEAILYPNMNRQVYLIFKSIYKPYWQLYGELFLEEIEGLIDNETCYEDPRYMDTCPQVDDYRWVAPTLTAIYLLITNILLINLLIAMFSYTFQRVQNNAETIWRFYRCGLIHEYRDRPALVPPLIIFNHIWLLGRYCLKKNKMESHTLKVRVDGHREEYLNLFERKHMENYFIKKNQDHTNATINTLSSVK